MSTSTQATDGTITILLVEDDPGDQELTRRAFEEGKLRNRLQIVSDGEEALDYLRRQGAYADASTSPRPQLVLLDLNLPRLDGRAVLEQMRSDPDLRRIPVVALTTSRQEEDIVRSYDLGVNSYISKPVSMDSFVDVLRTLENYWFQVVMLPPSSE